MSRENVEAVRSLLEAWNRGDREGWMASGHPDIEWSSAIGRQVEGDEANVRGKAGLHRFWDDFHSLWDVTIDISEIRATGDTVVALAEFRAKGKASGAENARPIGYVFEFEDGLIRRATAYLSPAEALAAAGL